MIGFNLGDLLQALHSEPVEPKLGPPLPLNAKAVLACMRHDARFAPLIEQRNHARAEHDRWCAELKRLDRLAGEAKEVWGEEMAAAMPELKKIEYRVVDRAYYQQFLRDEGPATPTPQSPDWVKDLIDKGEAG